MARIVFIMDVEEGHVLPSFALAKTLQERGHDILYLSVIDNEELIKEHGFGFQPIFEECYPRGFRKMLKQMTLASQMEKVDRTLKIKASHQSEIVKGYYDGFLTGLGADLFIISVFLRIDALLLYYKLGIRPVVLTPYLREPGKTLELECLESIKNLSSKDRVMFLDCLLRRDPSLNGLAQIVAPLATFRELVVCPHQLEIDTPAESHFRTYLGPGIRKGKAFLDIRGQYGISEQKKIIYASLGSQAIRHGNTCDLFFYKMLHAMKSPAMEGMHLVLCTGPEYVMDMRNAAQENVTILGWAPQLDILKDASVAVVHGGLGTVKECIYYGVPMFIFPLGYDQPANARRVHHHRLGIFGNISSISLSDLISGIRKVASDENIRNSIDKMRKIFQEEEKAGTGARIIEDLLVARPAYIK